MHHIATTRLQLRPLHASDAPFMLKLLNEPAFIANIGDKNAHDLLGALRYIEEGPQASYRKHGHGLLLVERLDDGAPVGICGLVKRDGLAYPDIGYAFLNNTGAAATPAKPRWPPLNMAANNWATRWWWASPRRTIRRPSACWRKSACFIRAESSCPASTATAVTSCRRPC